MVPGTSAPYGTAPPAGRTKRPLLFWTLSFRNIDTCNKKQTRFQIINTCMYYFARNTHIPNMSFFHLMLKLIQSFPNFGNQIISVIKFPANQNFMTWVYFGDIIKREKIYMHDPRINFKTIWDSTKSHVYSIYW